MTRTADPTLSSLQASVGQPHELPFTSVGLDREELMRLAARLEAITAEELRPATLVIPAAWPVTDAELDAAIDFAAARAGPAAERLRRLTP